MPEKSYCFNDLTLIKEASKIKIVGDQNYRTLIPKEMSLNFLNSLYVDIFGLKAIELFLSRFIFDANSILITDFAKNGFFWAQIENDQEMKNYTNLYDMINEENFTKSLKIAGDQNKKCLGKYLGEWFRAYIIDASDTEYQLFFFDYGTTACVNKSDTRFIDDDKIWSIGPIAFPFIVKDIPQNKSKIDNFASVDIQYKSFAIKSIKLIQNNAIFEVELVDSQEKNVLDII